MKKQPTQKSKNPKLKDSLKVKPKSSSQNNKKKSFINTSVKTKRNSAAINSNQSALYWPTVFNSVSDGICLLDKDQRILQCNNAMSAIFKKSNDKMVGKHCWEIVHGTRAPIPECPVLRMKKSLKRERMELKSGNSWFDVTVDPVLDADKKLVGIVHIVRDITERKRAEENLQESESKVSDLLEFNKKILDNSSVGILTFRKSGECVTANAAAAKILGATVDQILAQNFHEIPSWKKSGIYEAAIKVLKTRVEQLLEVHVVTTFGKEVWSTFNFSLFDFADEKHLLLLIHDITERKRVEEELRVSEARYRAMVESSPNAITQSDLSGKILMCNMQTALLLGYDRPEDLIGRSVFDLFPPNELERASVNLRKTLQDGIVKNIEYRLLKKDGSQIQAELSATLIMNAKGKPASFMAITHNITERKRMEESLKLLSYRNEAILASVPDIIMEVDNNKIYKWANRAGMDFFGDDVIGKEASYYFEGEQETYGIVQPLFKGDESIFYVESWQRRRDGERRLLGWWCHVLKDKEGNVTGALSSAQDITERKRIEEALRESEERFRSLYENSTIGLYRTTPDGKIILANPALVKMLGYTSFDELAKRNLEQERFEPSYERKQFLEQIELNGEVKGLESVWNRQDGTIIYVRESTRAIRDPNGNTLYYDGSVEDISERKQAEEALLQSETKYRDMVEQINDVLFTTDIECRFTYISPTVEVLGGYKQEDMVGHLMFEFIDPAFLPKIKEQFIKVMSGHLEPAEYRVKNKAGEYKWVRSSSRPILEKGKPIGMRGVLTEISARKKAEESLRETRDYLENLFTYANAPIIVWNPDLKITRFNLALEKLTGYTVFEVVDKHLEMLFPSESRKSSLDLIALTSEGEHLITVEIPILCKDGDVRTVLWSSANIYAADGKTLVSTIAQGQDITEQKMLQREMLQLQKMESIGTLAGGIAHDFNNILGIILGYSTMLERNAGDKEKISNYSKIICQAVNRGAALVRQILTFARKTDIILAPMSLAELVTELISMLEQTFPKVITFKKFIDANIPVIDADRTQIHQAMLNICVNARDAMPNGGSITIKVERQTKNQMQERIPVVDQDFYICVSISDTGEGMNEATRQRIFDPFFTTKEQGKGTGLGLAVVYGIIQSHHGFIHVESEMGYGTTFRLYFPISTEIENISDSIPPAFELFNIGGTESILFVEDEEALIEMVRLLLESKGYTVFTAKDGIDAIKVYEEHEREIKLVLTDMGLPGMIGIELFKELREINPNISVIMASGFFEPDVKSELFKAGAKGFIQKPYSPDELLKKMREVLDGK